jgi:hypothetical protein
MRHSTALPEKTYLSSERVEVPFILSITSPPIGQKRAIICNVLRTLRFVYQCLITTLLDTFTDFVHNRNRKSICIKNIYISSNDGKKYFLVNAIL